MTKSIGPQLGWINGWAIFLADMIVMRLASAIAGHYTFLLFSWHWAENSNVALIIGSILDRR